MLLSHVTKIEPRGLEHTIPFSQDGCIGPCQESSITKELLIAVTVSCCMKRICSCSQSS